MTAIHAEDIDEICFTPATALADAIRRRVISPVEIVEALLARIDRVNPRVNAFITLCLDDALEQARRAERELSGGRTAELGALHGLPVTVKDLSLTAGVRTTFGHSAYREHVPTEDAPIWARLKAAGAILIGKTATPAFGHHSVTESAVHGVTNNPWRLTHTTGGSSGGAAAAVAAGMGPLATGSDGGGSIRVPSSLCGTVGLKASRGRIPCWREGSSLEEVAVDGPITRTVADTALMLNVVAGPDPYDMFALLDQGTDYLEPLDRASVAGLRVAYSPDLGAPPVEPVVRRVVGEAAAAFESELGAIVDQIDISLPDVFDYFVKWWGPQGLLSFAELAEQGIDLTELSHSTSGRSAARKMTALDYVRTMFRDRERIHTAFADVFVDHDLLIWPTTPMPAYPHPGSDLGPTSVDGQPVEFPILQNQRYTEAIAHAGYPAISIPAGFSEDGLPIGLQIAGAHGADAAVLNAAAAFEQARPWVDRRPPL